MAVAAKSRSARPISVGMGQVAVGRASDQLNCVLGSCIGLLLYHPRLHVAGLAHVMLADSCGRKTTPGKFADTAVPHLVELLEREGAGAAGLVAKLAGGANMFGTPTGPMQIGQNNAAAVLQQLKRFRIRVVATHLGGNRGRRITLNCANGELTVEIPQEGTVTL